MAPLPHHPVLDKVKEVHSPSQNSAQQARLSTFEMPKGVSKTRKSPRKKKARKKKTKNAEESPEGQASVPEKTWFDYRADNDVENVFRFLSDEPLDEHWADHVPRDSADDLVR